MTGSPAQGAATSGSIVRLDAARKVHGKRASAVRRYAACRIAGVRSHSGDPRGPGVASELHSAMQPAKLSR